MGGSESGKRNFRETQESGSPLKKRVELGGDENLNARRGALIQRKIPAGVARVARGRAPPKFINGRGHETQVGETKQSMPAREKLLI